MNFLFKLSGSIACYKACDLISRLIKAGHQVQTVTTASAERFVGPSTLEGLTGKPNMGDLWKTGDQMAHIRLPEWADAVILCPASANTLNKLAAGVGDDLVTTLFLAHDFRKPYYLAPAMNTRMLEHPATRAAMDRLKSWGVRMLPTDEGMLACRDFGQGKLLNPETLFRIITQGQVPTAETGPRILITAGGTEEPIDSVRVITNLSSGKTGSFLADCFSRKGAHVTLLRAHRAQIPTSESVRQRTFGRASELEHLLREELEAAPYDLVIHAAAVSDFTVASPEGSAPTTKIASGKQIQLTLEPAPKLLPEIRSWALPGHPPRVVGFKLTDELVAPSPADIDHPARGLLQSAKLDAVVHNARAALDGDTENHPCHIHFTDGSLKQIQTKPQLAEALWELTRAPSPPATAK